MDNLQVKEMFAGLEYLRHGGEKQRNAWEVLGGDGLFHVLERYEPVLAGTIPLGVDVRGSDLDIVCRYTESEGVEGFIHNMRSLFGRERGFFVQQRQDTDIVLCRFEKGGFPVEIYASREDPLLSKAFRHMVVEYRVLLLASEKFKNEVISLKSDGIKTEPAFARLLELDGDPYNAVLLLEDYTDQKILNLLNVLY